MNWLILELPLICTFAPVLADEAEDVHVNIKGRPINLNSFLTSSPFDQQR